MARSRASSCKTEVEAAVGIDVSLPATYQDWRGGLLSLKPLHDGNIRLLYPMAIGVPTTWGRPKPPK
jgi:hypothetical protein